MTDTYPTEKERRAMEILAGYALHLSDLMIIGETSNARNVLENSGFSQTTQDIVWSAALTAYLWSAALTAYLWSAALTAYRVRAGLET